eukprot:gene24281-29493_t
MSSAQEVKLETLQKVREIVKKQEDRFTASKIIEFNRFKYVFGVLKSYISVYVFAAFPQLYWRYHAVGLFCMVPIQVWRWFKIKQLFYMLEYCWVSSFVIGSYLLWLNVTTGWTYLGEEMNWWPPNSAIVNTSKSADGLESGVGGTALQGLWEWYHDPDSFREGMALMIFASGMGPLGCAVILLNNALVPHSIDHSLSLMIHLHNMITSYCILFKPLSADQQHRAFGRLHFRDKSFTEYVTPALVWLWTWFTLYTLFMQLGGVQLLTRKNAGSVLSICVSYLFYKYDYADGRITFAWIMLVCFLTALNGANWYSNNMTRFTKLVDGMITEEQKKH